jgi:hypothetical protein
MAPKRNFALIRPPHSNATFNGVQRRTLSKVLLHLAAYGSLELDGVRTLNLRCLLVREALR